MKTNNFFVASLIIFALLLIYSTSSRYSESSFKRLVAQENIEMTEYKGEESRLFHIYKDNGGFGSSSFYIYKKDEDWFYYKLTMNARYTSIWNGNLIVTCKSRANSPSNVNKWVRIVRGISKTGNETIEFGHGEMPKEFTTSETKLEGIYKWEKHSLNKIGNLDEFCSLHEFESGLYLLTPPGFFYKEIMDIDNIEIR